MKLRRWQYVSEDRLVKPRRCKEASKKISVNGRVYSESIPIDLVIEILSRLPTKSIANCRYVSKLWASILCRPDFTELFLTRSQARPQLLITSRKPGTSDLFFFSAPQPPYSDGISSLATATYLLKIPFSYLFERFWHINGLIFVRDELSLKARDIQAMVLIICNPSTGQSLVLPKMKPRRKWDGLFSYFGYDPIEKQIKVLSINGITCVGADNASYQVLTLGTKEMSWRKVECSIPHFPSFNAIYVNGVLYYQARGAMIVCFDIRSEKFCFLKVSNNITRTGATLINYNGKLGSLVPDGGSFSGRSRSFVLWILEDTEKQEWSKHSHVLPPLWKDVVGGITFLDVVGMVGRNEIVLSPNTHSFPFDVFFYNMERNMIRRVEIQGLKGSRGDKVQTFVNHVEDIKPIDGY